MSKVVFNQKNVDRKITEVKALPEYERQTVVDAIKLDLRAWLLHNFEFPKYYEKRMALWPKSLREETGFGIGTALLYDDWKLEIKLPHNIPTPASKTKQEQKVSGAAGSNGVYTITKSHSWSW
jgi:hypothetical protein